MKRAFPAPGLSLALALLWLALHNTFAPGHVVLALVIAWLAPLLLLPVRDPTATARPPRMALALRLVARLVGDIGVANLAVARRILFVREASLAPTLIELPLRLRAPNAVAILAGIVTLTPGTLSADIVEGKDGFLLQVHALDAPDPQALADEIRRRYEDLLLEMMP